jgi:DUF1680 family protein
MKNVMLTGGLLGERQRLNRGVTIPHIYSKLAATGRIASLRCAPPGPGAVQPHPFWDSDIGKTVEAISYGLVTKPDPDLETRVDEIVLSATTRPIRGSRAL